MDNSSTFVLSIVLSYRFKNITSYDRVKYVLLVILHRLSRLNGFLNFFLFSVKKEF